MKANLNIAKQFILDISGINVSDFECRSWEGTIQFSKEDVGNCNVNRTVAKITRNLGVKHASWQHNGTEFSWELPDARRMSFVWKDWGEIKVSLIDFKAAQ